jgi:hypothetical protein
MNKIIAAALVLSACGRLMQVDTERPEYFVDPAFDGPLAQFHADMAAGGVTPMGEVQRIEFDNSIRGAASGLCNWHIERSDMTGDVLDRWGTIKIITGLHPVALRVVFYHEMGHCEYGIDHAPGSTHIMSAAFPDRIEWWGEHWDAKVSEMIQYIREHRGESFQ